MNEFNSLTSWDITLVNGINYPLHPSHLLSYPTLLPNSPLPYYLLFYISYFLYNNTNYTKPCLGPNF